MKTLDEDEATAATMAIGGLGDEAELVCRAAGGDREAFELLYDRYLARTAWYFTIFARRKAEGAIAEVLKELFGTLGKSSDLSFAERAYRIARATELRHANVPAKVASAAHQTTPSR